MKIETFQVRTRSFVARIRVQNGRIVDAAPILKWSHHERLTKLTNWLDRKFRGQYEIVPLNAGED